MKQHKILFAFFLALFLTAPILAEDDEFDVNFEDGDDEKDWNSHVFNDWDFDRFKSANTISESPTIEVNYGMTMPEYDKDFFKGDIARPANLDLRLGSVKINQVISNVNLIKYNFDYLFVENFNKDIGVFDEKPDQIGIQIWKFGFSEKVGYGWEIGDKAHIILYNGDGLSWTKLDFTEDTLFSDMLEPLNKFGEKFRFSRQFEAGINIRLIDNFAINAGFERTTVFPRHMFWYWAGSEIVEAVADGGLNYYINKIKKSSPTLAPVAFFLLKNGLSYGFSELRRKNMNWPFETASPFIIDNFKVGVSFMF